MICFSIGCAGVPPSRIEVGGGRDRRLAISASSASASTRPDVPVDLAGGYVARERDDRVQHGSFLELAVPVWRRGRRRLWIGGRMEMYWNRREDGDARGAGLLRAAVEVTGRVRAIGGDGDTGAVAYGRYGVGAFAEVGPQLFTDGTVAATVNVGLSVRIPFLAVATSPKGGVLVW